MHLLTIERLTKSFGGLKAVNNVTFHIDEGEIIALIGPNGSGKTTTLNLLTGFLKPDAGKMTFRGRDVTRLARSQVCPTGIARTFQLVKPFPGFTALQNVMIGRVYGREPTQDLKRAAEESKTSLERVGLLHKANVLAQDLTLMQRKRLELARALAAKPQLLLLDELMAGLNPSEAAEACVLINQIRDTHVTILIVEHIVKAITTVSDRVVVLNMGTKIAEGHPTDIIRNPQVIDVYLGRKRA